MRPNRVPAVAENLQRCGVVPVVNDATENVRVTVGRDRLKKVPADDLAAFDDIRGTERFGTGDDVGGGRRAPLVSSGSQRGSRRAARRDRRRHR